ncbi:hypothetical protein [Halobacteriovorax sp. RZ-2]|uniref:hypothetical protein n=1 Tax=unclassified Halobacteriovorax TaxID=2639665 RepID=UPI00371E567E
MSEQQEVIHSRKSYKKNWAFMGSVFFVMAIIYVFFKRDLYLYVCEQENNAPACFLLSDIYQDDGEHAKAQKYLELSCQNKYEIACNKLGKVLPATIVK